VSHAVKRLHPAVAHHLVNSLGWRSLRPLQEQAVAPVLAGEHALLVAPTAGGKTEAAMLPLLSRMSSERWSGTSVLYVCPLRALLNNLTPRLSGYCELLGRSTAVWHGDIGEGERRRILGDPPDVLLTTPESIEAMGISRRVDERTLFAAVRAIVIDEVHAFAGDDRGWHLLALLSRLDRLAQGPIQRIGLSATVGNPTALLEWITAGAAGPRTVVAPWAQDDAPPALEVDSVGNVANAAKVVSALHRGEKRLVFADSRAHAEEFAAALRAIGTTVLVSHSSLSADERRTAERAFAEERDCVIVATSTLELGIDVGDLDRVIQLGAPRTVASLLQRMGRTGRRPGTTRNCLFLATRDEELLQALALTRLVECGWVETLVGPPRPVQLAAQQLLARVLTEGRLGRSAWPGPFRAIADVSGLDSASLESVVEHMVRRRILEDLDGFLHIGVDGERLFGRRHFMEVTSSFLTESLLAVRWGARLLGQIDPSALVVRNGERPVVLLGGSAWAVGDVDWQRRLVWVEPSDDPGRSRWSGAGGALSLEVCHAIRETLADAAIPVVATQRARGHLADIRDRFSFVRSGHTALERNAEQSRTRWWTFAGARSNNDLLARLELAGTRATGADDLGITLVGSPAVEQVRAASHIEAPPTVDPRRLKAIKFHEAVPEEQLTRMLAARDTDVRATEVVLAEPLDVVST
jgi:ATP-dependent Lhr-like helicase